MPQATVVIRYMGKVIRVVSPCCHEWHDAPKDDNKMLCWFCKRLFGWK